MCQAGVFGVAGIDHVPDPPQDSNATWQDGIGAVNQSDGQLDESESVYLSALSSEVDEVLYICAWWIYYSALQRRSCDSLTWGWYLRTTCIYIHV